MYVFVCKDAYGVTAVSISVMCPNLCCPTDDCSDLYLVSVRPKLSLTLHLTVECSTISLVTAGLIKVARPEKVNQANDGGRLCGVSLRCDCKV